MADIKGSWYSTPLTISTKKNSATVNMTMREGPELRKKAPEIPEGVEITLNEVKLFRFIRNRGL